MTRILVGTDTAAASERLAEYLRRSVGGDDEVYVVNSQVGGDATTDEDIREGTAALETLTDALDGHTHVESHQYVRGNDPVEDLMAAGGEFDADEYAIALRKRTSVGKVVFGSTAQNLLQQTDRPVRCVPLE
jgi:nucleotide-binding universal stress UspA family protein